MKPTVAIFGQHVDPHVKSVTAELRALGLNVEILNIFVRNSVYCVDDLDCYTFGKTQKYEYTLIWWRLKGLFRSLYSSSDELMEFDDNQKKEFWYSQWMTLFNGLCLDDNIQINPLRFQNPNKLLQLRIAKNLGLHIPKTIVSNDINKVLEGIQSQHILLKPLNGTTYQTGRMIFAQKFNRAALKEEERSISFCPSIFQQYVEKKYEIRSFVFGKEVYSVKINSQENPSSKIDWRVNTYDVNMFEYYELPEREKELLIAFLKNSNLLFGVFDLIRHPSGKIYFLECNPEGQWLFMEQATGQKMTKQFAKFLFDYSAK